MNQSSHAVPESSTAVSRNGKVQTSVWSNGKGALLLSGVAALLIFIVSLGADLVLLRDHEPARMTIEVSDAISSLVIGALSYRVFRLQQQRRDYVRQKLEVIADMNHHVRNALQVISLSTHGSDQEQIATVRESVNRIQWALRELLPKI